MEVAWDMAIECDPGCYCEQILTEYQYVVAQEWELTQQIEELNATLVILEDEQYNILESCPEYEAMTVESAGWMFGGSTTTTTTTTTTSGDTWGDDDGWDVVDEYSTTETVEGDSES